MLSGWNGLFTPPVSNVFSQLTLTGHFLVLFPAFGHGR